MLREDLLHKGSVAMNTNPVPTEMRFVLCVFSILSCVSAYCLTEEQTTGYLGLRSNLLNEMNISLPFPTTCNPTLQNQTMSDHILDMLQPWDSVDKKTLQTAAQQKGVAHYQIVNGILYRSKDCYYKFRCKGIEYFILKLAPHLPNMEFVVNVRDYPSYKAELPIFSFSIPKDSVVNDIMFPAWAFWAGGPWMNVIKNWQWPRMREEMLSASALVPWAKKESSVFFRGSRTNKVRDGIVYQMHGQSKWNVGYTPNQSKRSNDKVTRELRMSFSEQVLLSEHCKYKYLLNFDGVAASFRLKNILLCGSLVFYAEPKWLENWYYMLIPWVHYVPTVSDGSYMSKLVYFFERHDDSAAFIAKNGQRLISEQLGMDDIYIFWDLLLRMFAKRLAYTIDRVDPTFVQGHSMSEEL